MKPARSAEEPGATAILDLASSHLDMFVYDSVKIFLKISITNIWDQVNFTQGYSLKKAWKL